MGRITGSSSIETLVRVGIEKENGLAPDSKMVVLHDFTPCVDDELEVKRGTVSTNRRGCGSSGAVSPFLDISYYTYFYVHVSNIRRIHECCRQEEWLAFLKYPGEVVSDCRGIACMYETTRVETPKNSGLYVSFNFRIAAYLTGIE